MELWRTRPSDHSFLLNEWTVDVCSLVQKIGHAKMENCLGRSYSCVSHQDLLYLNGALHLTQQRQKQWLITIHQVVSMVAYKEK